ncbi:hypothetical protein EGR_11053 [Echinococcus granulosus]|uniref:Uncharacterized protein n=1 Tax=Echinococcus granulosus TaxID=6210 RepID=W6U6V0_ECHGR|nr:hypothetical protein EGR_11053 [Echinococcus granulosus]EUB54087.1 hypothetical protein EGR_11053 [Echinococcus granulosus]
MPALANLHRGCKVFADSNYDEDKSDEHTADHTRLFLQFSILGFGAIELLFKNIVWLSKYLFNQFSFNDVLRMRNPGIDSFINHPTHLGFLAYIYMTVHLSFTPNPIQRSLIPSRDPF